MTQPQKPRLCQAVTKLAESGHSRRVETAGAKARPYFSMPCGPTKVVPLLQSAVSVGFVTACVRRGFCLSAFKCRKHTVGRWLARHERTMGACKGRPLFCSPVRPPVGHRRTAPPEAPCQIESGQRFGPISAAFETNYTKFHRSVDDFENWEWLKLSIFNQLGGKCPLLQIGTLIALNFHRFPCTN